jgi:hypothetical protein
VTPTQFLTDGHAEDLKRGVHRVMQVGAGTCLAFNGAAWLVRRKPHLLIGVLIYGTLLAIETVMVNRHVTQKGVATT